MVRGRDILTATPGQIFLQRALGYPVPEYAHIPLLTDGQGRRLAKRDRDLDLDALLQRHTVEELLGILAFSCGLLEGPQPVTWPELIRSFSWDRVRTEDCRLPATV